MPTFHEPGEMDLDIEAIRKQVEQLVMQYFNL